MPQEQKKPSTGGNKPKPPPAPARGNQSASAKERSKAQSRPVSTKSPTSKAGTADGKGGRPKGGNTPRPGARPAPQAAPRRFSGTMIAWLSIGLVVLIVAIVVIVSQLGGGSTNTSYTPVDPGAGLGGQRRDQHPRFGLQHRRDRTLGHGEPPDPHPRPQPAGARRQEPVDPLLRCRVLPVLRRRALGHHRRPRRGSGPGRTWISLLRLRPTSTRGPTP